MADVVPSIPHEDYPEAVRGHLLDPTWLSPAETLRDRAFVVLTMCRGLRTLMDGEGGSKVAAASWAATRMPEFSRLIRTAVEWRTRPNEQIVDDDEVDADIGGSCGTCRDA